MHRRPTRLHVAPVFLGDMGLLRVDMQIDHAGPTVPGPETRVTSYRRRHCRILRRSNPEQRLTVLDALHVLLVAGKLTCVTTKNAVERVQHASAVFLALVDRDIGLVRLAVPPGWIGVLDCRGGSCLQGIGSFGSDLGGGEFGLKCQRGLELGRVLRWS